MAEPCLVCLKPLPASAGGSYHTPCARELFGSRQVPALEVDPANLHLLGQEMAGRVSISGAQKKLALGRTEDRPTLRVVGEGSLFILKPQTEEYPDLPQNEQLCTRMARAVGLRTPPTGLVRLSDGRLALLSRRFDRTPDGHRLPVEDFCQLAGKLPREKYLGSAEQCAKHLLRYSDERVFDAAVLFRSFLFAWWIGNGDLHLKNLALIGEGGRYRLTPLFDLVCTEIYLRDGRLALTVGGKHGRIRARDWVHLGRDHFRLTDRAVAREIERILEGFRSCIGLVHAVPIRADLKSALQELLRTRALDLLEIHQSAVAEIAKPTKATHGPLVPTGKTAMEVVGRVQDGLGRNRIELPEDSALRRILDEVGWLARDDEPVFSTSGAHGEDPARAARTFLLMLRLHWLGRVLERASGIRGAPERLKHLGNLVVEPSGAVPDQAGDRLLELEVAGALDANGFLTIEMSETDVEIVDPDGARFGIECKRPRKPGTLARNVRDAAEQLRERRRTGFVVLSLDEMAREDGERGTPWILTDDRHAALSKYRAERLDPIGVEVAAALEDLEPAPGTPDGAQTQTGAEALPPAGSLLGVVLLASVVVATNAPSSGGTIVRAHTLASCCRSPSFPDLEPLTQFLANLLVIGADRLQR